MPKTPTISFVSLGCSKNLVDSERMLGLLAQGRYAIVPESEPADLVIVNTCGFIEQRGRNRSASSRRCSTASGWAT